MGTISLPHRPLGTDTRQIAHIIADFDAILAQANGSLQASTNVAVGVAASTLDGNTAAEGSSSSLARADHKHKVQGVEQLAADPTTSNFVGRVYFNTVTERLMYCTDSGGSGTFTEVVAIESANNGAIVYVASGAPAWTNVAADDQILRAVGAVPTWVTPPGARAFHNANQSIADATPTVVALNSEDFDQGGFHDTSTNNSRLTVPAGEGGRYLIGANISWASGTVGNRTLEIRKNGTSIISSVAQPPHSSGLSLRQQAVTVESLAETDYVEMLVTQSQGSSINLLAVTGISPVLWIERQA